MASLVVSVLVRCDSGLGGKPANGNRTGDEDTEHEFDGGITSDANDTDEGPTDSGADTDCDPWNYELRCPQNQMVTDRASELSFGFTNSSSAGVFLAAFNLCGNSPDAVNIFLQEIPMFVGSICSCPTASCGRWCGPVGYSEAMPFELPPGAQIVSPNIGDYGYRSVNCDFDCSIFGECRKNSCQQPVAIPSGQYHASFCISCVFLAPSDNCSASGLQFCPNGYFQVSKAAVFLPSDTTVVIEISNGDLPTGCSVTIDDGGMDGAIDAGLEDTKDADGG
ncbi:MAG: hypothetical protein HY975_04125 [Candidatus Kerfeldbacteria bacterium]|nr:hypothetical protein [Candidatus Kerfeldbacteria bacterium]